MQKGDIAGLVIVISLLISVGIFIILAPQDPAVMYAPVEVTGSSIALNAQIEEEMVKLSVTVKRSGFVTIHQAIGDAPGPLIGQSELLRTGEYTNLTVTTTRLLTEGSDYFVLLFVDDGDGVYEPGVDLPVMSDGQIVKQKLSL